MKPRLPLAAVAAALALGGEPLVTARPYGAPAPRRGLTPEQERRRAQAKAAKRARKLQRRRTR